jgi:hypothetical protein
MSLINHSDRFYETTKLLRRSKGVFSKTRRTLTSPPQFRITRLSGPEGFYTTAFFERYSCIHNIDCNTKGTVTSAHNCIKLSTDDGNALLCDWKPSLLLSRGKSLCKRNNANKQFLSGSNHACPKYRYISDRRPRGVSLQQLDFAAFYFVTRSEISLMRILNGSAGYRTDSEDSLKSPGRYCRIRLEKCKMICGKDAVIPDICLERRSISTVMYCKD